MQELLSDSYACLYCPAFKQVRFGTHCLYCVPLTRHVTMWHLVSDARLGFFAFFRGYVLSGTCLSVTCSVCVI